MRKRAVVLLLCTLLAGCAVQRNRAPQITPATASDLNLAYQVSQANKDYETFFRDAGDAQRQGLLGPPQILTLNSIGRPAQVALENANQTLRTYQATRDLSVREQVVGYIQQVNGVLGQLLVRRATMLNGGQ
jgi:hypothetical protein